MRIVLGSRKKYNVFLQMNRWKYLQKDGGVSETSLSCKSQSQDTV